MNVKLQSMLDNLGKLATQIAEDQHKEALIHVVRVIDAIPANPERAQMILSAILSVFVTGFQAGVLQAGAAMATVPCKRAAGHDGECDANGVIHYPHYCEKPVRAQPMKEGTVSVLQPRNRVR